MEIWETGKLREKCMPQPDLSLYYSAMENYNNFMAIVVVCAAIIAYFVLQKRGTGINISMKLWMIVALGIIVRLPLMLQDFWYDEAFTSAIVQTDTWAQFFTAIQGDVHPPGYYFIVRSFTQVFGHNDIVMRLPALLSGVGMIVAMYHIAKQYGGARVGRYAALLTAIMPAAVYYSTEARYPMFLALMLAFAFIGMQRKTHWMVAIGLSAAALSHVNAWFYVLLMCLIYVVQKGKLRTIILPIASIAAWFPFALMQARDVNDGFWITMNYPFLHVIEMTVGRSFGNPDIAIVVLIITTSIIFVAVWQWRKQMDMAWLALVAIVPLSLWFVGIVWQPIYLSRTLLFSAMLLIVPMAWWLDAFATRWLVVIGTIAMVVGLSWMYVEDRGDMQSEALKMCDGYDTIFAITTNVGVLANHYTNAKIIGYAHSDNSAQTLTQASREVLFDDIQYLPPEDERVCILSQVSGWNTPGQMLYLGFIKQKYNLSETIYTVDDSKFFYYLALYKETS
jgi:uncharacterized membrane protein